MKVYRVENAEGQGPYGIEGGSQQWRTRHHVAPKHPEPYHDGISDRPYYYLFGFCSMERLEEWFSAGERSRLKELGFKLSIYEAQEVISGGKQVVFSPRTAELVSSAALSAENSATSLH